MLERQFQPGDRVRTRIAHDHVQVGTLGTVQLQLTAVRDLYPVLFDGHAAALLMRSHELERAEEVRTSAPEVKQKPPRD